MQDSSIITHINTSASSLTEEDVEKWVIPQLLEHYKPKINFLAGRVYGRDAASVARAAFTESAKITIRSALSTFLFKKEHWKGGRNINSYLLISLKRLANKIFSDQAFEKKQSVLLCPACKEFGNKVFLILEDKLLRCRTCTNEIDRLEDEFKLNKVNSYYTERLRIHKLFALHSRHGFRCECGRFIPENFIQRDNVSCPYSKCSFFGPYQDLKEMTHPAALINRTSLSLDATLDNRIEGDVRTRSLSDYIESDEITVESKIAITENFKRELDILSSVIDQQIRMVQRTNSKGTYMQKLMMYEGFKRMVAKFPEEMVSYLVHEKQSSDFPIQSRIFQEYLICIENALPFTIEKHGEINDVISINDPNLDIFDGKSVFNSFIKENGVIPNNTIETYTGLRKFKEYGPCFLGKLLNIVDNKGKSYIKFVKNYSFVDIHLELNENVIPGTEVVVTHYRIPSHYEMKSMVYLQRIRDHLVEKIKVRLNSGAKTVLQFKKAV